MEIDDILNYCIKNLKHTVLVETWGEKAIFYNPDNLLKRGIYVLTIKEKDGENDKSSNLNRKGVYRLNLGLKKDVFLKLFGEIPKRPAAGKIVDMNYDFTRLDEILPHPVYAWMGWICILNPSKNTSESLNSLISESYNFAKEKFRKKII